MIRVHRLLIAALLVLPVSGCRSLFTGIFGDPRPPIEQYRLVMPTSLPEGGSPRAGVLAGGLAIAPYVTRGIYDRAGIAYRIDDVRLESYPSRTWAIPLRDMLGEATEAVLREHPLTTQPADFDPVSTRSHEFQWRGTVVEFEEVNRGRQVLAAVHLEAAIVRTVNDSVVWRGAERIERAVPEPVDSMPRVVETLSALTGEVILRLVERARTTVMVPTAAAAPPPR